MMDAENREIIVVNALSDTCPIPVVKAKKAINALKGAGEITVLVDNEIAVQNLQKMAGQKKYKTVVKKKSAREYEVQIIIEQSLTAAIVKEEANTPEEASDDTDGAVSCALTEKEAFSEKKRVVAIGSGQMGSGDEKLGRTLMKGFLYALARQEELPSCILFYNSGAYLTCEDSESLEDLRLLEEEGTVILTCGTCLDYYGLKEKLSVGEVTNMYTITEIMTGADSIIKP